MKSKDSLHEMYETTPRDERKLNGYCEDRNYMKLSSGHRTNPIFTIDITNLCDATISLVKSGRTDGKDRWIENEFGEYIEFAPGTIEMTTKNLHHPKLNSYSKYTSEYNRDGEKTEKFTNADFEAFFNVLIDMISKINTMIENDICIRCVRDPKIAAAIVIALNEQFNQMHVKPESIEYDLATYQVMMNGFKYNKKKGKKK